LEVGVVNGCKNDNEPLFSLIILFGATRPACVMARESVVASGEEGRFRTKEREELNCTTTMT
jgi:hypothetical protein